MQAALRNIFSYDDLTCPAPKFQALIKPWVLWFLGSMMVLVIILASSAWAGNDSSRLQIPQIKYRGGNFNPRPEAVESLLAQVAKRTSVEVKRDFLALELTNLKLFQYPMIYLSGDGAFEPFSEKVLRVLRNYLGYGGFLLIDDSSAIANSSFDGSIRKMIRRLFPNTPLKRIPRDHSIFRSFYLINRVTGRVLIKSHLEGINIKGRTVLVYSVNDLGGAWSANKLGHWNFDVIGGGVFQRKNSLRLGVNIIMYALTLDYKKDMVHLPIILERLRKYHSK